MTTRTGVWIDHRKAVIVRMGQGDSPIAEIESNAQKHPERAGDSPLQGPYEAGKVPADDKQQRIYTGELNHYYDRVIAAVCPVDSLLILGPGEAKIELKKRMEHQRTDGCIAAIETTDKMTHRQLAAKVFEYFSSLQVR